MFARFCTAALAVGLVWVAGCGPAKLDETRTKTLDPRTESEMTLALKGQSAEQNLTVQVDSKSEKVDVFVVLAKDFAEFDEASPFFKTRSAKSTASKNGVMSDTVTTTIPANTDAKVVVALSMESIKPTDVTVKLSNKK